MLTSSLNAPTVNFAGSADPLTHTDLLDHSEAASPASPSSQAPIPLLLLATLTLAGLLFTLGLQREGTKEMKQKRIV